MSAAPNPTPPAGSATSDRDRDRLLAGLPVAERQVQLAGISTAVLEGGDGPPMVLLHGPGESAVNWRWVIPELTTTHRIVAPDLPAHGQTEEGDGRWSLQGVLGWLGDLVERTCPRPPVLVGHVLGGALAARFAARHGDRLRRLVLVDSLGLGRFRPSLPFLFNLLRFQALPSEGTYRRFMRQCAFDLDALQDRMGERWTTFRSYNLALARSAKARAAGRMLRDLGLPRIPPDELGRIETPTDLIWGRHDRALRLKVAQKASRRYGWPLHVIPNAADDPPRDAPEAFLEALLGIVDETRSEERC